MSGSKIHMDNVRMNCFSPNAKVRVHHDVGNCTVHLHGFKGKLLPVTQFVGRNSSATVELGAGATGQAGVTLGAATSDVVRNQLGPTMRPFYQELHPGTSFKILMGGVHEAVVAIVISTEKADGTRMSYFGGLCEVKAGQRFICQSICGDPEPGNILPASIADLPPNAQLVELVAHGYMGMLSGFVSRPANA